MRRFFLLILLFSCSDELVHNDSIEWIKNLIVNIDRSNNELYIQAEISPGISLINNSIDSVLVNLEYVGFGNLEYNRDFLLYDNGENGDIIPENGIYTLIDDAEEVDSPDEQADIININFPTSFQLDNINSDNILFSITIKGKKYLATASLFENHNVHTLEEYVNIDNTNLEIQINKSGLYIDDDESDDLCNRIPNKYEDIFYPISFDWPDALIAGYNDYFLYESGFSVSSIQDCASTGTAIFKFILNDLDTGESVEEDRTIVIFGCGDGVCEGNHENISTCPGDCIVE